MYHQVIQQFAHMLSGLSNQLDKAQAFAESRKFDFQNLLGARLAPDQFPLTKQIQSACDSAKFAAARLSGQEAPSHPDTEQTYDEFKARIQHVIDYLRSFKEEDFAGASERKIVLPFMPDKFTYGNEYLINFAQANFYFHLTHAYAIMRHNGVELGKMDYITYLPMKPLEG
ncbi:MAG: DUF1993 family protein [Candidatus Sericytochromatia bacterium]